MEDTGPLTLLMNVIGPVLRRSAWPFSLPPTSAGGGDDSGRRSPTDAATKALYDRVERERERKEGA